MVVDRHWLEKNFKKHGKGIIENWVGPLNTPNSRRVDDMFESLIGLKNLSDKWQRQGMSAQEAKKKLDAYLGVRGQIVHRNSTTQDITTNYVKNYIAFIHRLAVRSNNTTRKYFIDSTGKFPWSSYRFHETR